MANGVKEAPLNPQFPTHNAPRVWLITSGDSPVGISLARHVLAHGDYVVTGVIPAEFERYDGRTEEFKAFLADVGKKSNDGWKDRLRVVKLDVRMIGQCQAAIAEAVSAFEKIDILFCCTSQAVIGTVEELAASERTRTLVRDQFETNFFGPLNIIRAVIPEMRRKTNGHIIVLSGITGHLGTPGLGMYCSSQWALEGFCDSVAYEIAPFNIKLTIVQSSIEIGILTNKITSVPPMPEYSPEAGNRAPIFRGILNGLLNRLPAIRAEYPQSPISDTQSPSSEAERQHGPSLLKRNEVVTMYPPLSETHVEKLISETVHCLTAIGGHNDPPSRHIVGAEGVASVKEKLKTISEELEDFVESSVSADVDKSDNTATKMEVEDESPSRDYPMSFDDMMGSAGDV